MNVAPVCCQKPMETVSQISTGKFIDITTYRCDVCESEVVERRSIKNKQIKEGNTEPLPIVDA